MQRMLSALFTLAKRPPLFWYINLQHQQQNQEFTPAAILAYLRILICIMQHN